MRAYKVVGFAVNIASRLQSEADPGSIPCGFLEVLAATETRKRWRGRAAKYAPAKPVPDPRFLPSISRTKGRRRRPFVVST
jgi:class 3 adenylate cyclase